MSELLYNQKIVFISAKNTINALAAKRAQALVLWEAKSWLTRQLAFESRYHIEHRNDTQIEICELLMFRVENSLHDANKTEWGIALTDRELNCIRDHWSEVLDPPAPPPNRIIKKGMA
jgi:hypothetical protein